MITRLINWIKGRFEPRGGTLGRPPALECVGCKQAQIILSRGVNHIACPLCGSLWMHVRSLKRPEPVGDDTLDIEIDKLANFDKIE